ncbi:hypothetical protein KIN20_010006 [Parelaphostrongylus tenuis]|uniref:Uncharacterized protein n=1 Tax=Parelaphostrongylus tenuis TaxID=148309 RepID=A0AAD5MPY5_PARTN|nr:hypothetical protein KIN20_010006 [Parelaphostrongylus tenuis]
MGGRWRTGNDAPCESVLHQHCRMMMLKMSLFNVLDKTRRLRQVVVKREDDDVAQKFFSVALKPGDLGLPGP